MQTLRFILFSFVTLTIISNAQTVIPPGDVSGTWTWGGSPYEIQGEITIPDGLTLTIEPGVLVEFQGHYKLNVQGRLLAVGTEADTIVFTINDTTGFHDPNIPDGGWAGIRFINVFSMSDSSKITYCKIEFGKALGFWPDDTGGGICVDGFDKLTISNCLITNNITTGNGGGIALWNSNPEITGNTISNNTAQFGGGIGLYESSPQIVDNLIENNSAESGGGIVCNENSNPTIINTSIENNTAESGGGIVCWGSSPVLDNVTFSNNSADWGGGISTYNSNLQIENCNFISNEALNGWGGGITADNGDLQIDNCSFAENEAPNGVGGAISFGADTTYSGLPYQVTITNTSFSENTASALGGVNINNRGWIPLIINVTINNCEFLDNVSDVSTGLTITDCSFSISNSVFAGNTAVTFVAGAGFTVGSIGTVSNCLFASNIANTGGGNWGSGGVSVWAGANVDFMNCTFADNLANYGAGLTVGGGGIATTTNCIFWGNSTDQIALETWSNVGGTLTVNYCDVQGGEDSVNVIDTLSTLNWDEGNIDADPFFVDPLISDYHLQDTSPCIQTAIDSIEIAGVWYYCPPYDIEGNPRPNPPGTMPDMGAYESPFPVGVEENEMSQPNEYALYQNYPNPFNPTTTIKYQIPELSFITLKVYDVLGSEIATLVNEEKSIGTYEITWYAENLPSGIYFYKLQAGTFVETKKMMLIK